MQHCPLLICVDSKALQEMFDLYSLKRISAKEADRAKEHYGTFLTKVVACNKNESKNFDMKTTRCVCTGW